MVAFFVLCNYCCFFLALRLTIMSLDIYIDDILVASGSFPEHITHITQVLKRLQGAGLRVKPSKCTFAEKL